MSTLEKLIFKPAQINDIRKQVEIDLPETDAERSSSRESRLNDGESTFTENQQNIHNQEHRTEALEEIKEELEQYKEDELAKITEEIEKAKANLGSIKEEGKNVSFQIAQEAKEKAKKEMDVARSKAEETRELAQLEVGRMLKETEMHVSEIEHEAYQKGYDAGRELGFKEGEAESQRLIGRLGAILGRAIDTREQLIADSEKQMVDLVLMIARKIIKHEIMERKEVVLNNIREVIKGIKERDRIDIRVNFMDLELTAAHKDELIQMIEALRKINVYEDSRVDRGGCIIETDVASIDARISTQFNQIEEAIRNVE